MSAATFFHEFLRNWQTMGAVVPSSPILAARMMEAAEVGRARHVLELGPGTGAFTAAIQDTMPRSSDYLGIELNDTFVRTLRPRFPSLSFVTAPAQDFDLAGYCQGKAPFDVIVSGLPWTAFPRALQVAILNNVLPHLAPGGCFATFAYWGFHHLPSGRQFRSLLHEQLPGVETSRVVWANMPPAFVYVGRK
ncbi:MAG: methyltransferase domain-containing protein [Prosthecobacter sp.]|nr:methyltransferase domain-containing protein [Prosthecobacter sp.]